MRRWLPLLVLGSLALLSRSGTRNVLKPQQSARVARQEREIIVNELAGLGWPAPELVAAVNIESGWRADAMNPGSHAVGLIQFMPSTLAAVGFRKDLPAIARALKFRELSPLEQLPWMRAYFARVPRWQLPGDTYLAIAAPGFIGKPDGFVAFARDTAAWKANPAWRPADDGDITAGSIRALLLRRMQKAIV